MGKKYVPNAEEGKGLKVGDISSHKNSKKATECMKRGNE